MVLVTMLVQRPPFSLLGGAVQVKLWLQQRRALTTEIRADMDKYAAAWARVLADPREKTELGSVAAVVAEFESTPREPPRRSELNLRSRSTRDQLLIMLTQAWGLNHIFQELAAEDPEFFGEYLNTFTCIACTGITTAHQHQCLCPDHLLM